MKDSEIERWCQQNNWTEPRQLELGIWVAFPPGGLIETPIPFQGKTSKAGPLENMVDFLLLVIVTVTMVIVAVIMSPCFIEPIISRYRDNR